MLEGGLEDGLTRWAAMTAIAFAVLAGLAGILGQDAANAAFELEGKANLDKVEMADQWAFYQARRIKLAVYRTHEDMLKRQKLGALPPKFQEDIEEYERRASRSRRKPPPWRNRRLRTRERPSSSWSRTTATISLWRSCRLPLRWCRSRYWSGGVGYWQSVFSWAWPGPAWEWSRC